MRNLFSGELQLAQSRLEMLEAFRVINANLPLRWMAKISPSLLAARNRASIADTARAQVGTWQIETQVLLFGWRSACEQVIQDVEIPLSRWYTTDSAPLKSVVKQLATNECWVQGRCRFVLEFEE